MPGAMTAHGMAGEVDPVVGDAVTVLDEVEDFQRVEPAPVLPVFKKNLPPVRVGPVRVDPTDTDNVGAEVPRKPLDDMAGALRGDFGGGHLCRRTLAGIGTEGRHHVEIGHDHGDIGPVPAVNGAGTADESAFFASFIIPGLARGMFFIVAAVGIRSRRQRTVAGENDIALVIWHEVTHPVSGGTLKRSARLRRRRHQKNADGCDDQQHQ